MREQVPVTVMAYLFYLSSNQIKRIEYGLRRERVIIRKILLLLCITAFSSGVSQTAYAMDFDLSDARIDLAEKGLAIDNISEDYPNHLIAVSKVQPGDTFKRAYIITNHYKYGYQIYLKAQNAVCKPAGLGFRSQVYLKLVLDGETLYDGTVCGSVDRYGITLENNIDLGFIEPNSSRRLEAIFEIEGPGTTNKYMSAKTSVDWMFQAIRTDSSVYSPGEEKPDPTPGRLSTGDLSKMNRYLFLLILSGIVLREIIWHSKKKKKYY